MPQRERPEEAAARELMASARGLDLTHADTNGGVDYLGRTSSGRTASAEVTTVTDGSLKSTQEAWRRIRDGDCEAPSLLSSWAVTVDQERVRFNGILEATEAALRLLEDAGLDRYEQWNGSVMWLENEDLRPAIQTFARFGVTHARVFPTKKPEERRIFFSLMGGWQAKGSDAALALIEAELLEKADNVQKLVDAEADESHLFLWLDSETPGEIARPFTGGRIAEYEHFGLPTRPPEVDAIVDAVWIVHRRTGRGWLWERGVGWSYVGEGPEPESIEHPGA